MVVLYYTTRRTCDTRCFSKTAWLWLTILLLPLCCIMKLSCTFCCYIHAVHAWQWRKSLRDSLNTRTPPTVSLTLACSHSTGTPAGTASLPTNMATPTATPAVATVLLATAYQDFQPIKSLYKRRCPVYEVIWTSLQSKRWRLYVQPPSVRVCGAAVLG